MDRNETLADLAEAVRKMARDMEENADWKNDVIVVDHTLVEGFNNLADRIDAAAKRETVAGNAAKLREALENLVRFEEADLRQLEHLANRAIDEDIYGRGILLAIVGAIRDGKKALAAPPRNCDRFATADEARDAWWQEEILPRVHGQKDGVELAYHKWLFAPAAQEVGRQ